ncbi:winged helix DNA-binding domain-containing protein [Sphaerisporangium aureirubrum]|uniref:Winged helix DNA-binding domain-containing protein n=1 Tax=Sphaerisporangium aureirubrum TaxID=1544736 RepID=A0ABW1NYC5_9ACTN
MTPHEIGLLRLVAQRIAGPGTATPADAVRLLGAMQAQDPTGAILSVALRTEGGTRQAVQAAYDAGEIVKSWPMRGTLHLVAAEDLPWLLPLTTPRILGGHTARLAELGLDARALGRARELAEEALSGGRSLRRADLMAVWDKGGLETTGQRGYHMLGNLSQSGVLCFGPTLDGEQAVVLIEEWIPNPRELARDEALGELATRYFLGHGPATLKDFMRWAHQLTGDARTGLTLARPALANAEVDGTEYFMAPGTPDLLSAHRAEAEGLFLLPGFDEYVLGYQNRSAVLAPEFADRIVPGGNGVFRPTVVNAGQIIGTWKQTIRTKTRTITPTPFTTFPKGVPEAIDTAYAALP